MHTLFASQLAEKEVIRALGVGLGVIVCLAILWVGMQRAKRGDNLLFLFAAMTVLVFSLVFTALRGSFDLLQEPRYLLPLYSAVPLGILAVYQLTQKVTGLRIVLLGGLLVFNLYGNLALKPELNLPYVAGKTLSDNRALIDWLDAKGIQHVYTDYWIGYWLAYESQESIIPYIIGSDHKVGWNRYPPCVAEVKNSPNPAYIFIAGSKEERSFADYLLAQNIQYDAQSIIIYTVYWNLGSPVQFPLKR